MDPTQNKTPKKPKHDALSEDSVQKDNKLEASNIGNEELLPTQDLNFVATQTELSEQASKHHNTEEVEETINQSKSPSTSVLKSVFKRANPVIKFDTAQKSPDRESDSKTTKCLPPFVEKLKTMADKQYHKGKQNIKKITLRGDKKIDLDEKQEILNLKVSPKADRSKTFASYVVKQDSDDILDIVQMDESPSEVRKKREEEPSSIVVPDEIIELPALDSYQKDDLDAISIEPTINELLEEEFKTNPPPQKAPRKSKEHHYEDIQDPVLQDFIDNLKRDEEDMSNELQKSLKSSAEANQKENTELEATLSTSDEVTSLKPDDILPEDRNLKVPADDAVTELKSNLRRETSPGVDKKVTFSPSTEDEPSDEPHREDVDLPDYIRPAIDDRWSKIR